MACYALFLAGDARHRRLAGLRSVLHRRACWSPAVIAGYHYRLIRDRTREGAFKAFLHNNWIGAAIFAGIVLDQWKR